MMIPRSVAAGAVVVHDGSNTTSYHISGSYAGDVSATFLPKGVKADINS